MIFGRLLPILFISPSLYRSHALNGQVLCRTFAAVKNSDEGTKVTKIVLNESDLIEKFVRGSGPGGQNVNKTSSKVQLTHVPSGITVSSNETRETSANRKIARRKLTEQLDLLYNGKDSKIAKKQDKIRRRKSRSRRRANKKYNPKAGEDEEESDEQDDDDEDDLTGDDEQDTVPADIPPKNTW